MQLKNVHELFVLQIKDLYSAENQLLKSLSRLHKRASNQELKDNLLNHLEQTKEHINRLEEIAGNLEFNPKGHVCKAMKGLIEEANEILECKGPDAVLDAGIIASAQRVEHYEISAYGSAMALAKVMKHSDELELLKKTLEEEKETDKILSKLAESEINKTAFDANLKMESED